MNKKAKLFLGSILVFSLGLSMSSSILTAGPKFSEELEQMKKLEGTWAGTVTTKEKTEPAQARYIVTAKGTTVVEILFPDTPDEVVSVYYDNENGVLTMRNFSEFQAKPQMDLKSSSSREIIFGFSGNNQFDLKEPHMHELTIFSSGENELVRKWAHYQDGKPHHEMIISAQRAAQ